MSRLRHHMRRCASILLLAVLLLVPLALSGHRHAMPGADDACAACAVTHHAPIARATAPPTFALGAACAPAQTEPLRPPTRHHQTARGERAPPRSSTTFIA